MNGLQCNVCGKELRGRQEMYCSDKCGAKAWRERNPAKCRSWSRTYQKQNRDYLRSYRSAWKKRNPEKVKASRKRSLEKDRARQKLWRQQNSVKLLEWSNAWKKRNPEKVRAMNARFNKIARQRLWAIDGIQGDLLLAKGLADESR